MVTPEVTLTEHLKKLHNEIKTKGEETRVLLFVFAYTNSTIFITATTRLSIVAVIIWQV